MPRLPKQFFLKDFEQRWVHLCGAWAWLNSEASLYRGQKEAALRFRGAGVAEQLDSCEALDFGRCQSDSGGGLSGQAFRRLGGSGRPMSLAFHGQSMWGSEQDSVLKRRGSSRLERGRGRVGVPAKARSPSFLRLRRNWSLVQNHVQRHHKGWAPWLKVLGRSSEACEISACGLLVLWAAWRLAMRPMHVDHRS